jgi:hypothetical protein
MSAQTFTRLGLRCRCFKTPGGRWGPGNIHLQYWSKEHRDWVLLCRPNDAEMFSSYHGWSVPLTGVTCKVCSKRDPRRKK